MFRSKFNLRNVVAAAICLAGSATMFAQETGVVINGVTWATRNVDAPNAFTATPEDGGMYYQWNSKVGWTAEGVPSDGTSTWNAAWNGNNATSWETANNVCPSGWRIPTIAELEGLLDSGYEYTTAPVEGVIFGTGGNTIFLPVVNALSSGGTLFDGWDGSSFWSSSATANDVASDLVISNGTPSMYYEDPRSIGVSVRCVKDVDSGLNNVSTGTENATVTGYFDILGRKLNAEPTKGIYIILYDNGETKKMMK